MKNSNKELFEELKKFTESVKGVKMHLLSGSDGSFTITVHDSQDKTASKIFFKNENAFEKYLKDHSKMNRSIQKSYDDYLNRHSN